MLDTLLWAIVAFLVFGILHRIKGGWMNIGAFASRFLFSAAMAGMVLLTHHTAFVTAVVTLGTAYLGVRVLPHNPFQQMGDDGQEGYDIAIGAVYGIVQILLVVAPIAIALGAPLDILISLVGVLQGPIYALAVFKIPYTKPILWNMIDAPTAWAEFLFGGVIGVAVYSALVFG